MEKEGSVRIDKWLWAVRLYKTRSMATDACRKGRILIDNVQVKPSRIIKQGEVVVVRKTPVIYTIKIVKNTERRVSASLAQESYVNLTPEEELLKLGTIHDSYFFKRDNGTGRPTKKERRLIDKLKDTD